MTPEIGLDFGISGTVTGYQERLARDFRNKVAGYQEHYKTVTD
jgi:hypothetical protein